MLHILVELFCLMELKKSNEKWSSRLDRARAKDFTVKQEQVEVSGDDPQSHVLFINLYV